MNLFGGGAEIVRVSDEKMQQVKASQRKKILRKETDSSDLIRIQGAYLGEYELRRETSQKTDAGDGESGGKKKRRGGE